jgi:hypothetical protein
MDGARESDYLAACGGDQVEAETKKRPGRTKSETMRKKGHFGPPHNWYVLFRKAESLLWLKQTKLNGYMNCE